MHGSFFACILCGLKPDGRERRGGETAAVIYYTSIMTSKLYVGNLPFATTAQEVRDLFSRAGGVSAVDLIFDKITGRSRGFAFVNMSSVEDAQRVMERFHGYDVGGRSLTVSEARPKEPRTHAFAGEGGRFEEREERDYRSERHGKRDHRSERNYRG